MIHVIENYAIIDSTCEGEQSINAVQLRAEGAYRRALDEFGGVPR
jgi:hypothetical protein